MIRRSAASRARPAAFWSVSLLFVLSGFTGLGYQIIWFKRFTHLWGNSTLAMAAVVASFLAGLGLGAYVLGKLADRVRTPLLWYGFLEAAVGILALLIPYQIRVLTFLYEPLYTHLGTQASVLAMGKLALTFLVLGPPCLLMGGTLPMMLRHFTPPGVALKEFSGWLYGVNTLGAAAGCYLAGFHLLPALGLHSLNACLVALNLLIAVGAAGLSRQGPTRAAAPARAAAEERKESGRDLIIPLCLVTAMTGCAALILEVVWTRQLALILGGSVYAFTAMLFPVLVGIGLGSLFFHWVLARMGRLERIVPPVILGLVFSVVLGKWMISPLTITVGLLKPLRASETYNGLICVAVSGVLELLPCVGMGILFPLFVHLTRKRARNAGRAIGLIYGLNVSGSIVGSAAASLLLIPGLGLSLSVVVALLLYAGALVLLFPAGRPWRRLLALSGCFLLISMACLLSAWDADPRVTDIGMYLYGYYSEQERAGIDLLFFSEGAAANVLVTQRPEALSLRINGKVDASDSWDMMTQLAMAYIPLFLRPGAKDILVIGMGSGTTPGAALEFPDTRVTCCEIEPAVLPASTFFSEVNHAPHLNPRFSFVSDDGRSFLQGTDGTYDLILSEPSNPWLAGISNLFTREFYDLVQSRLTADGILAQWIQAYAFSPDDYSLVVRTVLSVFPDARLVRVTDRDTILLAYSSRQAGTLEDADRVQALVDSLPAVRSDLETYFGSSDVRTLLQSMILLDYHSLRRLSRMGAGEGVNTDINSRLEFDAPLGLFSENSFSGVVDRHILSAIEFRWLEEFSRELGLTARHAEVFHRLAGWLEATERGELRRRVVRHGLDLDPGYPPLLVDHLIHLPALDSVEFEHAAGKLAAALESETDRRLFGTLLDSGHPERAEAVLERLTRIRPDTATAWAYLGLARQSLGRAGDARDAFHRALALDPLNSLAGEALASPPVVPGRAAAQTGGLPRTRSVARNSSP